MPVGEKSVSDIFDSLLKAWFPGDRARGGGEPKSIVRQTLGWTASRRHRCLNREGGPSHRPRSDHHPQREIPVGFEGFTHRALATADLLEQSITVRNHRRIVQR